MGVEKLSLSFEPELAAQTRAAADEEGKSVSAFVAEALEHKLKLHAFRELLRDWEAESGPIADEDREWARKAWRG